MINKVGFVHTSVAIADMFRPMIAQHLPDVSTFHIADDSLIQDLLALGGFSPSLLKRLCAQVALAEEAGAELIMVTCSSIAPGVDVARKMVDVPVMKVDEPMAEAAVAASSRIGVLATAKTTMSPSSALIELKALEAGKDITLHKLLCAEAFDRFLKGDMAEHDRLVLSAASELKGKVGVAVLAQASMGHLKDQVADILGVEVLTSPPLAMKSLARKVAEG